MTQEAAGKQWDLRMREWIDNPGSAITLDDSTSEAARQRCQPVQLHCPPYTSIARVSDSMPMKLSALSVLDWVYAKLDVQSHLLLQLTCLMPHEAADVLQCGRNLDVYLIFARSDVL